MVALEINNACLLSVVNNFSNSETEQIENSDLTISGSATVFDVRQIQCDEKQFLAFGKVCVIPDIIAKNCCAEKHVLKPYQLLSNFKIDAMSGQVWDRY